MSRQVSTLPKKQGKAPAHVIQGKPDTRNKKKLTNHNTGNLLGGELGGRTQVGGVPKEQGTGKR